MPRAPRIDLPGALYHVISRGNERRAVFRTDRDRRDFLDRLSELAIEKALRLFAFCLLDNHFHLLIERTAKPPGLAMKRLLTGYAVSFNLRHGRVGHLFHGRFKSPLCDRDSYLLELARYIHLNPVRARIVERPEQYRWSSHRAYLGHEHVPGLECEPVLALLHHEVPEARARFQRFVEEGLLDSRRPELSGLQSEAIRRNGVVPRELHLGGAILGNRGFAETTISEASRGSTSHPRLGFHPVDLDDVADLVARATGIDILTLRRHGRRWDVAHARTLLCTLAVDEQGFRPRDLAHYLAVTDGAVSHALKRGRSIAESEIYRRLAERLRYLQHERSVGDKN